MKALRNILSSLVFMAIVSAGVVLFAPSETALACDSQSSFFEFPTWHEYLDCGPDGTVSQSEFELNDVWLIGIAILEIIIRVGAFISFVMVIYGGFKYITSQGSPEGTSGARKTIISAIAGLVITVIATVSVRFGIGLLSQGSSVTTGGINVPGSQNADASIIDIVFNLVYGIAGIVAVIYIVIGGIKFTTSTGDPGKVTSARNTIIYALVGLVIVISASLITGAVLDRL